MATISSAGLGSGLDVETIVSKLMSLERTPITNIQTASSTLKTKISAYGQVQSALSSLQDAARKLNDPSSWAASAATSSDSTAVAVTTSGAATGSYSLSVSSLATSQSLASQPFTDSATVVGQGTLTIELGSWNSDQTAFTTKTGTTAISISIESGKDSLSSIRDSINAANAGVVASIITDTSGSRLVMRSSSSGESNAFRVTSADPGLAALTYDPSAGSASMTATSRAGNAQYTLDGLALSSESNTVSTAVDGLNISLLKTTTSAVTLNVSADTTAIKKTITDFLSAYNSTVKLLRDQTKYDESTKTAGTLQGDSRATGLLSQLRALSSATTSLGGSLSRLSDLGIDTARDGTLSVTKSSKLDAAISKLGDLKAFFSGVDSANASNNGLAQRWASFAARAIGSDGAVTIAQQGLQSRVKSNDKQIEHLEDRMTLIEKRMRAQYTSLDTRMSKLTALSNYVTQQFSSSSDS